ncbi:hypothetical protein ACL6YL_08265 [Escherichia coli]|uniref:hypothetical protein n=1 Tax=Escherichia coli TaxID=562 RepID=UPI004067AB83
MTTLNRKLNVSTICIYFGSLLFICLITSRYFPIEPDVANSPIVWREFIEHGISAFSNWKPTIDNWYFTVYPINFMFFYIFNDDGKIPLIITTALFSFVLTVTCRSIAHRVIGKNSNALYILVASLTFIPMYTLTFGFAAHPFSHNSTNMFGMICVIISMNAISSRKLINTVMSGVISTISSISDPWFLASYFLPISIAYAAFSLREKNIRNHLYIYLFMLFITMSNVIQKHLGLPIHAFEVVPFDKWIENAYWTMLIIGRSLNIFFIEQNAAYLSSLCVWVIIFVYSFFSCYKANAIARFFAIFSLMSLCGIVSSYIISYIGPSFISGRFFLNVTCVLLTLMVAASVIKHNTLLLCVAILFIASSLYSYQLRDRPLHDESLSAKNYISFLKKHNLHFGYGTFWRNSNTVTWLSNGDIHVTPVFFDRNNGYIDFNRSRIQTSDLWRTGRFREKSPERQFISIIEYSSGDACKDKSLCINAAIKQVGEPDEKLEYGDYTILVYNKRILP